MADGVGAKFAFKSVRCQVKSCHSFMEHKMVDAKANAEIFIMYFFGEMVKGVSHCFIYF